MTKEYSFALACLKFRFGGGNLVELKMREPSSGECLIPSSEDLTDHKRCPGLSGGLKIILERRLMGIITNTLL